jgi:hypothetical protein
MTMMLLRLAATLGAAGQCLQPAGPENGGSAPRTHGAPDGGFEPGDELYFFCDTLFSLAAGVPGCAICGLSGEWMPSTLPRCVANSSALAHPPFVGNRRNSKCNLATGVATRTDVVADYPFSTLALDLFPGGAPWLEPGKTLTDGLAFVGLSLTRNHVGDQPLSAQSSTSRQTQLDFNTLLDRDWVYYAGISDDGWLAGGGENGDNFNLPNRDSAHIEIMRVGSFVPEVTRADYSLASKRLNAGG